MTVTTEPQSERSRPPGLVVKDEARIGRSELGTVSVADRVVEKLAARAAAEIGDAGAAAPRVLGRSLDSRAAIGIRSTSLAGLPKTSARVDGTLVLIELTLSVRWPASIPKVTAAVRDNVRRRVAELTGLNVVEVSIHVADLVTELPAQPRVR